VTAEAAEPYVDAGATATDSTGQGVSVFANSFLPVDMKPVNFVTPTNFSVVFSAVDSSGNLAVPLTRTVSVLDRTKPVITLKGLVEMTLEAGFNYIEPGASGFDTLEGDISVRITVGGAVITRPTKLPSTFTLSYNLRDKAGNNATSVIRNVAIRDSVAPVITLNGNTSLTIEAGSAYVELGATATDSFDGNVTSNLVISVVSLPPSGAPASPMACSTAVTGYQAIPPYHTAQFANGVVSFSNVVGGSLATVVYTARDQSGNEVNATRKLFIVDTLPPVILLNGAAVIPLDYRPVAADNVYVDAGVTAMDINNGNLTSFVCVTVTRARARSLGAIQVVLNAPEFGLPLAVVVANEAVGTQFQIEYMVQDVTGNRNLVSRKVVVTDLSPPGIQLFGEASMTVVFGVPFVDPGAEAVDVVDGQSTLTATVNTVDVFEAGLYDVLYASTDAHGNAAIRVTRTVKVEPLVLPSADFRFQLNFSNPRVVVDGAVAELTQALDTVVSGYVFVASVSQWNFTRRAAPTHAVVAVEIAVRSFQIPYEWLPSAEIAVRLNLTMLQAELGDTLTLATGTTTLAGTASKSATAPVAGIAAAAAAGVIVVVVLVAVAVLYRKRRHHRPLFGEASKVAQFNSSNNNNSNSNYNYNN
jgi:hypothetical protein